MIRELDIPRQSGNRMTISAPMGVAEFDKQAHKCFTHMFSRTVRAKALTD